MIVAADRKVSTFDALYPVFITCRHFLAFKLLFKRETDAIATCTSIQRGLSATSINQLYAFAFKREFQDKPINGPWNVFDPFSEYGRMGIGTTNTRWRFSTINENYEFSPTYPRVLIVPSKISDNVLKHIGKFRSKSRIPSLSYAHRTNNVTITRSSQPMTGLKQNRSIQDEKLVEAIFASGSREPSQGYANLIIDARPTTNAMAQTAMGAGTENTDNYKGSKLVYLGIENIHAVRDSMNKLLDASTAFDRDKVSRSTLDRSNWLKHVRTIIDGTLLIVQTIHLHNAHTLIHCSDGWDRTAQLCSLAQICLDPYYRTISGFQVLLEKEWISFGHKFKDRCGHLSHEGLGDGIIPEKQRNNPSVASQLQVASKSVSSSISNAAKSFLGSGKSGIFNLSSSGVKTGADSSPYAMNSFGSSRGSTTQYSTMTSSSNALASSETVTPNNVAPREVSPVFIQFLDCLYQLWTQFPAQFEFNDKLLSFLFEHVYSCQFGNFLFNNEQEKRKFNSLSRSLSNGSTHYLNPNQPTRSASTRSDGNIESTSISVWDYINVNSQAFLNPIYTPPDVIEMQPHEPAQTSDLADASKIRHPSTTAPVGMPGTLDQEHSVLFPSSFNLKYWPYYNN